MCNPIAGDKDNVKHLPMQFSALALDGTYQLAISEMPSAPQYCC